MNKKYFSNCSESEYKSYIKKGIFEPLEKVDLENKEVLQELKDDEFLFQTNDVLENFYVKVKYHEDMVRFYQAKKVGVISFVAIFFLVMFIATMATGLFIFISSIV